jgi:hypothetical protein
MFEHSMFWLAAFKNGRSPLTRQCTVRSVMENMPYWAEQRDTGWLVYGTRGCLNRFRCITQREPLVRSTHWRVPPHISTWHWIEEYTCWTLPFIRGWFISWKINGILLVWKLKPDTLRICLTKTSLIFTYSSGHMPCPALPLLIDVLG